MMFSSAGCWLLLAFGAARGLSLVVVGGVALSRRRILEAAPELLEGRLARRHAVLAEHLVVAVVLLEVVVDVGELVAALAQLAIVMVLVAPRIRLLMMLELGVDRTRASSRADAQRVEPMALNASGARFNALSQ